MSLIKPAQWAPVDLPRWPCAGEGMLLNVTVGGVRALRVQCRGQEG